VRTLSSAAGSKKLGHGKGYRYAHDEPYGIAEQQYAPDVVADARGRFEDEGWRVRKDGGISGPL